jgi:putative acetyltransferase
VRIEEDDLSRPEVLALLEEHLREMQATSPPENVFALDAERLRSPDVTFWTAWRDDTLLGCAALKSLSETVGEVKSMRTPAALRRMGAGRALLQHVIAEAVRRGYRTLYLETGSHPAFLPAHRLYTGAGFVVCGAYGDYPESEFSVFMRLDLG